MQDYKNKFEKLVELGIVNENGHLLSGHKMSDHQQPKDKFEIPKQDVFSLEDLLASANTVEKQLTGKGQTDNQAKKKLKMPTTT